MNIDSSRLRTEREAHSWSQDELAIASGLSVRTIQRAEGQGVASLQTVKALAATLELEPDALRIFVSAAADSNSTSAKKIRLFPVAVISGIVIAIVGTAAFVGVSSNPEDTHGNPTSEIQAAEEETPKPAYVLPENWQDLPLEEKILGYWETNFSGRWNALNFDGSLTNPSGAITGNAYYTIRGDVITYGYDKRVISSKISFENPRTMVWRSVDNDAIVTVYSRDPALLPTNEETLEKILGEWISPNGDTSLIISTEKFILNTPQGLTIDTYYNVAGKILMLNDSNKIEAYAVNFHPQGLMTLTKPMTNIQLSFVRP